MTEIISTRGHLVALPAPAPLPATSWLDELVVDSNADELRAERMAELDDRRLLEGICFAGRCSAWLGEAIRLARAAFVHYDAKAHRLSHEPGDWRQPGEISYPEYFRRVALEAFTTTRNIWAAGQVLDRLIAENR